MTDVGVAIIGAGFAGIGVAIELRRAGITDLVMLEKAHDIGGVWRDNTYPGCRCDIPSSLYSFSFAPRPDWSDHYASQPEIWRYLHECVHHFDLAKKVRLNHEVESAQWNPDSMRWDVKTSQGPFSARMLVVASGSLNVPAMPAIPGLESFGGRVFHSAQWPADFDPAGQRIAVIGTGASAIQIVPEIAPVAKALTVFQRTPPWVLPRGDRAIPARLQKLYRTVPGTQVASRKREFLTRELMTGAFVNSGRFLSVIERICKRHLAAQIPDPALRGKLTPSYRPGCKRILLSDDWYPALLRDNVNVVTDSIAGADATGLLYTEPGSVADAHQEFDAVVLATGFRVTTLPFFSRIHGADGSSVSNLWKRTRPAAYLGSTISGFPNLVVMTGPNTGLGNSSMLLIIESQAIYASQIASYLESNPAHSLDVKASVQDQFIADVDRRLAKSVWMTGGCRSWYMDDQGRVTAMWPGRTSRFRQLTSQFNLADYNVDRSLALRPHNRK